MWPQQKNMLHRPENLFHGPQNNFFRAYKFWYGPACSTFHRTRSRVQNMVYCASTMLYGICIIVHEPENKLCWALDMCSCWNQLSHGSKILWIAPRRCYMLHSTWSMVHRTCVVIQITCHGAKSMLYKPWTLLYTPWGMFFDPKTL